MAFQRGGEGVACHAPCGAARCISCAAAGCENAGGGELSQDVVELAEILDLVHLGFDFGRFLDAGDIVDEALAALFDILEAVLERADRLAKPGTKFRQLLAAEDEEGDGEYNYEFGCSQSKHLFTV